VMPGGAPKGLLPRRRPSGEGQFSRWNCGQGAIPAKVPAVRLTSLRIAHLPPFGDVTIPFSEDDGSPRAVTVLFGGGGVGKTSARGAIAASRPGYAVALAPAAEGTPLVVSEWSLGDDDPGRPHPLCLATPTGRVQADEHAETMRRREQAHFDRIAKD